MADECAIVELYTRTSVYTRSNVSASDSSGASRFAIHHQYDRGLRYMIFSFFISFITIGAVVLAVEANGEHFGTQTPMLRLNLCMLTVAAFASLILFIAAWSTGQDVVITFDAQSGIRRYLRVGLCCRGRFYADRAFQPLHMRDVEDIRLHEWSSTSNDSDGGSYTVNYVQVLLMF
jgi:hypothetical protein